MDKSNRDQRRKQRLRRHNWPCYVLFMKGIHAYHLRKKQKFFVFLFCHFNFDCFDHFGFNFVIENVPVHTDHIHRREFVPVHDILDSFFPYNVLMNLTKDKIMYVIPCS